MSAKTYLADENIPLETIASLRAKGIEIISVNDVEKGMEDEAILTYAVKHDHIVLTFDKDFGELVFLQLKPSKGIILFRVHPRSADLITKVIFKILSDEQLDAKNRFIVVRENKVRVVPLPTHVNNANR